MIARLLAPHLFEIAMAVILVLLLAVALLAVSRAGLKADLAEERAERQSAIADATAEVLRQATQARQREQNAVTLLALADSKAQEADTRAKQAETDLAAAILRGERRVRPSICAGGARVPGPAATPSPPDAAADDGSRRVARIVSAARRADDTIRLCQETVKAYQKATAR